MCNPKEKNCENEKSEEFFSKIKRIVEETGEDLIKMRRSFHQIPELGFEEVETTDKICEILQKHNMVPQRLEPTGVTVKLGPEHGACIGLRADIDGLLIEEQTGCEYASIHKGKMHACGHDGHISALLGAGIILKEFESELPIGVKLIFQPSEENTKGAKKIIEQGVLQGVDQIFGIHIFSDMKAGSISLEKGPRMAQTDRFTIKFKGKGGHAGKPHLCVDATVMAAEFIMNVQSIVSREINPVDSAVVTIGSMRSGTQYNIISEEAVIEGTCRSFSPEIAVQLKEAIQRRASHTAALYGGEAEVLYELGSHPPVVNDEKFAGEINHYAHKLLDEESFVHISPLMLGEDFSWYQTKIPGVFAFLGCEKKGEEYPNHHPRFQVEESCLKKAVLLHLSAVFAAGKMC